MRGNGTHSSGGKGQEREERRRRDSDTRRQNTHEAAGSAHTIHTRTHCGCDWS